MNFGILFARHIHPETAGLARYAQELAGDAPMPPRRRFNPDDLGAIRNYIYMIEVLRPENDYFFSMSGCRMRILFGMDLAGTRLSDLGDFELRQALCKTYDCVVATAKPQFMRAEYIWPMRKFVPIERLLVPLADDDGQVCAICGISVPEIADIDLEMYAGHGPAMLVREDSLMLDAG